MVSQSQINVDPPVQYSTAEYSTNGNIVKGAKTTNQKENFQF